MGGPIDGPLKRLDHHSNIVLRGWSGSLAWAPIMPRHSGCNVISSGHRENYRSISFQIEWDMIVVTVFLSILNTNGIPFGSENRTENCHHDHIPFNLRGNGNSSLSVGTARGGYRRNTWSVSCLCPRFLKRAYAEAFFLAAELIFWQIHLRNFCCMIFLFRFSDALSVLIPKFS